MKSKEGTIEGLKRQPNNDGDGSVDIEVRRMFGLADFCSRQQVERMRDVALA